MLQRLADRFSPPKVWLDRDGGTHQTPGFGRALIVIPRAACVFRHFDLTDIPAAERDDAIRQRLEQATPFERYGVWLVRRQARVMAWIWDRASEPAATAGRTVPEPLMQRPAASEGLRLVAAGEGVEGQYWADAEHLRESHWWPQAPSVSEWTRFERACGLRASGAVAESLEPGWLERPWARHRLASGGKADRGMRWAGALLVLVLVVEFTAQGVEAWGWHARQNELATRIERLESEAESVLAARERARDARQRATQLLQHLDAPSQLALLASVVEAVEQRRRQLEAWRYVGDNRRGQLELDVSGVGDSGDLVTRLETLPVLRSVGVQSTARQGRLQLQMEVTRHGG